MIRGETFGELGPHLVRRSAETFDVDILPLSKLLYLYFQPLARSSIAAFFSVTRIMASQVAPSKKQQGN